MNLAYLTLLILAVLPKLKIKFHSVTQPERNSLSFNFSFIFLFKFTIAVAQTKIEFYKPEQPCAIQNKNNSSFTTCTVFHFFFNLRRNTFKSCNPK